MEPENKSLEKEGVHLEYHYFQVPAVKFRGWLINLYILVNLFPCSLQSMLGPSSSRSCTSRATFIKTPAPAFGCCNWHQLRVASASKKGHWHWTRKSSKKSARSIIKNVQIFYAKKGTVNLNSCFFWVLPSLPLLASTRNYPFQNKLHPNWAWALASMAMVYSSNFRSAWSFFITCEARVRWFS